MSPKAESLVGAAEDARAGLTSPGLGHTASHCLLPGHGGVFESISASFGAHEHPQVVNEHYFKLRVCAQADRLL